MEVREGQARAIGVDPGDAFHGHTECRAGFWAGQGVAWTLVTRRLVRWLLFLGANRGLW
jgi:hypothetical protein